MTFNGHLIKHFIKHYFSAKRRGHGVHSPFAYRLCEDVFYNTDTYYPFKNLAKLRQYLLENQTELTIEDFGAGSKALAGNRRKIKDIAAKGISSQKQSEIMYRLLNFLNCKTCIELGTSLGLNTLYLAANNYTRVTSIEGSQALHQFAKQIAAQNKVTNINFVCGKFDETLPGILNTMPSLDFLYIDGNHTHDATLAYYNLVLTKTHNNSVIILDDIYWSPGMTQAWNSIKARPEVSMSLDLFYFGILFFKEEIKEKVDLKLYI